MHKKNTGRNEITRHREGGKKRVKKKEPEAFNRLRLQKQRERLGPQGEGMRGHETSAALSFIIKPERAA